MIETISIKLATRIKSRIPESAASIAVMKYSIALIINTLSIILLSIFISILLGKLISTLIVLFGFAILRQVSGGYHLKSGGLCIVFSTLGIILMSFADFNWKINLLLNAISFIIAAIFSPSKIEKQTRIPPKYFPLLKIISLLMIVTSGFIGSSPLTASFFVQSLTLILGRR